MNLIELSKFIRRDMREHIALEPSQARQWTVKIRGETNDEIDAWSNYFARLSPECDEIVYGEPVIDGARNIALSESTVRRAFTMLASVHDIPTSIIWPIIRRELCLH